MPQVAKVRGATRRHTRGRERSRDRVWPQRVRGSELVAGRLRSSALPPPPQASPAAEDESFPLRPRKAGRAGSSAAGGESSSRLGSGGGDRGVEDCAWQTASGGEGRKQQQRKKRQLRLLKRYISQGPNCARPGLWLVPRKGAGSRKAATPTVTFKAISWCKSGFRSILLRLQRGRSLMLRIRCKREGSSSLLRNKTSAALPGLEIEKCPILNNPAGHSWKLQLDLHILSRKSLMLLPTALLCQKGNAAVLQSQQNLLCARQTPPYSWI